MNDLMLGLLVLAVGLSAFLKARGEGRWSWALFVQTMLAVPVLLVVVIVAGLWFARTIAPHSALLTTAFMVALIVAGVTALTIWVQKRTRTIRDNGQSADS